MAMPGKENVLVHTNKYNGMYVAQPDFDDNTVVAAGRSYGSAYDRAVKSGYTDPVVFLVPKKGAVYLY